MIPVEKIAGGTLGNLLYYVAIIGVLLVICTIIRLKVSFLRKAFIPASLLAGILGMILGPHVLGVIPADMMSSIGAIPSHMITIVFACMMLGVKKSENTSSMMHDAAAGLGWLWSNSFMQVGVACLLCAFLFTPVFGVNELFGSLFEIGFAGGHGTAGELVGSFAPGDRIGAIERNCLFGIFGTLDAPPEGAAVETASADAVRTGSATILSTVAGEDVRAYTVDISRVYHDGGCTRFLITVTDPDLLAATGGIVQGMSGSPILQNGRLIGAVTHVLLSDPAKGYGVSIDDMLAASAAQDKAA